MGYKFGPKSLAALNGVHPILQAVAKDAIKLSTQDFCVFEGLRTLARQQILLKQGMTRTLKSYHLKQSDGFSHAMDLVPYKKGTPVWDWQLIYPVTLAVCMAAKGLAVADKIVWGGAWDMRLTDFGATSGIEIQQIVKDYTIRHPGKDFIDGPHFQLMDK